MNLMLTALHIIKTRNVLVGIVIKLLRVLEYVLVVVVNLEGRTIIVDDFVLTMETKIS